ncbi:MAG TPA: VOC family protein [Bacteroidota bacterium]|nr:VOC family protein [Bacteroidota bacterium]
MPSSTQYFDPGTAAFMINYRVENLEWLLEQLRNEGVRIDEKREEAEYGKFAWIYDPDGNKIELWEPPKVFDVPSVIPMK